MVKAKKVIKLYDDSLNSLGQLPKDGIKKKTKKGDKDKVVDVKKPAVIIEEE